MRSNVNNQDRLPVHGLRLLFTSLSAKLSTKAVFRLTPLYNLFCSFLLGFRSGNPSLAALREKRKKEKEKRPKKGQAERTKTRASVTEAWLD